jgi:hypothetical protein
MLVGRNTDLTFSITQLLSVGRVEVIHNIRKKTSWRSRLEDLLLLRFSRSDVCRFNLATEKNHLIFVACCDHLRKMPVKKIRMIYL